MGVVAILVGLGLFLVLLWNFTVYALPAFVGFSAGWWALNHGAGIGCVVVGLMAGVTTLLAGRLAMTSRSTAVRWLVAALFVIPAAYAGYHIVLQFIASEVPSPVFRQVCALLTGSAVAVTTFARLAAPETAFIQNR